MNLLDTDRARISDDLAIPGAMRWTPAEICCLDCGLPVDQCPAAFHRHPEPTNTPEPADLAA